MTCCYKFTLLYRQSRDGNTVARCRELCNDKGPTIAIGKVLDTEEILDGYNPLSWGCANGHAYTKKSFIFALDKNMDMSIVSFVENSLQAIYDHPSFFPSFGNEAHDLYFGGLPQYAPIALKHAYQVPIRNSSDRFNWVDWEVFSVQT